MMHNKTLHSSSRRQAEWMIRRRNAFRSLNIRLTKRHWSATSGDTVTLGIQRESYNVWERRTPLCPHHVATLLGNPAVDKVLVQPSSSRIYSNVEYELVGATVQEDLSSADVILGVKRPLQTTDLHPNKTYMMFSHVIKGQPENMPLLQHVLDNNIELFDYECIVDGGMQATGSCKERKQKRLVAFGKFAGRAGMTDALNPLGRRLLALGFSTPFLHCPPAHMQEDWTAVQQTIKTISDKIEVDGLPESMEPVVFCMTGKGGNVHSGVMEVFDLLPHELVSVDELPDVVTQTGSQHRVYGVSVGAEDVFRLRGSDALFDRDHYMENPHEYESIFHERIAPYTNVLVNGMYWDLRYPRLLTKERMKELYMNGLKRLMLVVDISCDVNGSVEFLERTTNIDRPYFQYDPIVNSEVSEFISSDGVTVMGVDILPTELPRESSAFFGDALLPVLEKFVASKTEGNDSSAVPSELMNACIASDGSLTRSFQHLESFLKRPSGIVPPAESKATLWLEGHLFDSGFINHALDIIEQNDCMFEIVECHVRRKQDGVARKSNVIVRIAAPDDEHIAKIESQIRSLIEIMENAECSMMQLDHHGTRSPGDASRAAAAAAAAAVAELPKEENVLVLGSGLVSKSLVEYLGREDRRTVTVAGAIEEEARAVSEAATNGRHVVLDVDSQRDRVAELVSQADIVVSLLPAPMHPEIAEACIENETDLVTASYESESMRQLDERARNRGVRIVNEAGLDPGLDHMCAMKIIDGIHGRGGVVKRFSSVCGGLPAPEVAGDNPLMYKFSWSPMGVLSACKNDAVYLSGDETIEVNGSRLLQSAAPFSDAWPALNLECLPNRNSLLYASKYGIPHVSDLFRGTLRYSGFSGIMSVYQTMGLLENVGIDGSTWSDALYNLQRQAGFDNLSDYLLFCASGDEANAARATECLEFLNMDGNAPLADPSSLVDSFCKVLQTKCRYEPDERDMCLMHTSIRAVFGDGVEEEHHSSLQVFGDSNHSAMSRTVGYTAAAATDVLLNDKKALPSGLLLPTSSELYSPILVALEKEGVRFKEAVKVTDLKKESS